MAAGGGGSGLAPGGGARNLLVPGDAPRVEDLPHVQVDPQADRDEVGEEQHEPGGRTLEEPQHSITA